MKCTINEHEFRRAFEEAGRGDQFSYEGLGALFAYLEEWEEYMGVELELDVIGLCCEFTEYANWEEFRERYCPDYETPEEAHDDGIIVIDVPGGGYIVQNF